MYPLPLVAVVFPQDGGGLRRLLDADTLAPEPHFVVLTQPPDPAAAV